MEKKRVLARIDIKNKYVIKGVYLEGLRKIGNPMELCQRYAKEGIDEIVFMDAVAALYDRNSLIEIISEASKNIFIPITIGGGIRTITDIQNALDAGADKVAINTKAVKDPEFITEAVSTFGAQAIIGSIVALQRESYWEVFIDNARTRTHIDAKKWSITLQDLGVGEIMVTSIDRDGTKKGYDTELMNEINKSVSVPVIASGGAGNKKDVIDLFIKVDCSAAAIASIFHYNLEKISGVKNEMALHGIEVRK
jgi:cyclase